MPSIGILSYGTTYYWQVHGRSPDYYGAWSAKWSFITGAAPELSPSEPTLTSVAGSSDTILLQWIDNSSNETGFKIERKAGLSGTYSQITPTVGTGVTTFQDTGRTFGTTYCYRVRAYNAAGDSTYSNEKCGTALATPVPSSPANGATISVNSVALQWNGVTAAEGYGVDMGVSCGGTSILSNQATVSTSITVSSLTNGTYYWRVRTVNGTYPGLSADSTCQSFTIAVQSVNPQVSVSPTFGSPGTTFNEPGWGFTPNSTATLHFRKPDGTESPTLPKTTDASGTYSHSWTSSTSSDLGAYQYWAVDDSTGKVSNTVSFTISCITPATPSAPTVGNPTLSSLVINWLGVTGATSYNLYRSTSSSGPYSLIVLGITPLSYTNTGLSSGTTYYYKVSAVNSCGESSQSGYASGLTIPGQASTPTVSGPTASSLTISWGNVTGATSYKVYRSTSSTGTYSPIASGINSINHADTGLSCGTTYYYKVSAVNASGEGAQSNYAPGTTSTCDTNPPIGSISINGGATYTNSTFVTLTLSASDSNGVSQMCISNTSSCSSWESYTTSRSWTLPSGNGTKTVYVWFKDSVGNPNSSPYSDTIALDTTAPTNGTLSATAGNGQVSLSWSGFSDATSGIGSYKLVYSTSSTPSSCSSGTPIYSDSGTSYSHTGLTNGTTYYYRICATDNAGNISTGVTTSSAPLSNNPPTATTGTYQVISSSSAQLFGTVNPNGLLTTGWFQWGTTTSYGNTTSAESLGSGTSVVQMFPTISGLSPNTTYHFRAIGQNSAGTSYGADMTFTTPPPAVVLPTVTTDDVPSSSIWSTSAILYGTVNPNGAPTTGWFEWGTTTSYGNTTSASSGGSGTSPVPMSLPISGLSPNTTYHFRAVAQNSAGTSYGADKWFTTKAEPDTTPPTGSVYINSNATYTNFTSVTLTLSASDSSGVSQMCISNTSSCSSWESYTTSKSWTLSSGDGTKTVYVWFKDSVGNSSSSYSDTITLDSTAPIDGTFAATAGNGQVSLSWSGFSDATSGIGNYKLVYSTSGTPSSCSTGTQIYFNSGTSYTHTGLTNGTTYYYRVCATDNAGNTSTGATNSATPLASDTIAPTISISSPCSSSCTSSSSPITVGGTASDSGGSGLDKVFVYNSTNGSSGYDYNPSGNSTSFSVSGISLSSGQNTILAQAYDIAGNYSNAYTIYVTYCTDPYEPNDRSYEPTWFMTRGTSYSGKICSSTDVDWFKIIVGSPGTISFSLTVPSGNDYDLELYSPSVTFLKGSYNGTGAGETISHPVTTTGTYYVRVYGYPAGNGSYNTTSYYALSGTWP